MTVANNFTFNVSKKQKIKNFIRNCYQGFFQKSYSQEGEDMILNRFFEGQKVAFMLI